MSSTKPGFGFLVLISCCRTFCYACMFDLVVLDLVCICNGLVCVSMCQLRSLSFRVLLILLGSVFFSTEPRDWLGRTSPKYFILCRVGRKTLLSPVKKTPTQSSYVSAFWPNDQYSCWHCPHRNHRRVYETVRCPSVCLPQRGRTFAAVGPACRRYRSTGAAAAGECGQCRVVSVRR